VFLDRLASGECSVTELAEPFEMERGAGISYDRLDEVAMELVSQ
jgi:hypothetical protein